MVCSESLSDLTCQPHSAWIWPYSPCGVCWAPERHTPGVRPVSICSFLALCMSLFRFPAFEVSGFQDSVNLFSSPSMLILLLILSSFLGLIGISNLMMPEFISPAQTCRLNLRLTHHLLHISQVTGPKSSSWYFLTSCLFLGPLLNK